jgi:ABC-2 type transport system permease protein
MKRIIAQVKKEVDQFRRDKLTVALAFILPLLTFFIFGYAVRLEEKDIPIAIQDFDGSKLSRELSDRIIHNDQFRAIQFQGADPVKATVDTGISQAVVIIPPEFSRKMRAGLPAPIEILIDGTDVNNARVIKNSLLASVNFFQTSQRHTIAKALITPETRLWFNPGRKESLYVVPGVFGLVLLIYPSLLAALALVREKEQGTILQAYASSITSIELILGKALAYMIVGFGEAIMIFVMAAVLFGLRFAGDPTPFLLGTVIYLFASIMFGMMIGAGVSTQSAAVQAVAMGGFTTALLLSGYLYPLRNIQPPFDLVSMLVPARYYILLSRDAFVRGGGWPAVWYMPLALVGFALLYFRICNKRLEKMQLKD